MTGLKLESSAVTGEMLRKIPISRIESRANMSGDPSASLPPLRRQPDMTPEAFSRLVADHYRAHAASHANPGAIMAAQSGANPATVHSWIREARLRGLLPPARRRKGQP